MSEGTEPGPEPSPTHEPSPLTDEQLQQAIVEVGRLRPSQAPLSLEEQHQRDRAVWIANTLVPIEGSLDYTCRDCGARIPSAASEGFDPIAAHIRFHNSLNNVARWAHDGGARY